MSEDSPNANDTVVGGGGGSAATSSAQDPVSEAVARLQLLSPEARETVLNKLDPAIAERISMRLSSLPDRPHSDFSNDIAQRRQMLRELAHRVHARRANEADHDTAELIELAAQPAGTGAPVGASTPMGVGGAPSANAAPGAAASTNALDTLRTLHPASIARALQGERAEAWAIVLDRLDTNAQTALGMYLDATATAAIAEARERQRELAESSPQLVATIEAAIARTVVPRAMREQQMLLSTTPAAWAMS
jgi:hypothetical protein